MSDPNFLYSNDRNSVTDCSDKLATSSVNENNCQSPSKNNNSVLFFNSSLKNVSQFESSSSESDSLMPLLRKPEEIDGLSNIDNKNQISDGIFFDRKSSNDSSQWNNEKPESTIKYCKKNKNNMAKQKCHNKRNSIDDKFPFITKDNVFDVNLTKTSRGLGLSICGGWDTDPANLNACLIRIKRLYPLHPAYACGKLKIGDIILSVNGRNLTGLSYAEAIEILRMASSDVKLTICRPDEGILPPIPENSRLIISSLLDANSDQTDFCRPFANVQYMEFDVTLMKVAGSLGFTIGKDEEENSSHYIKDLVKEPALSCGNIQSGDKIILVNGVDISDMSHSEAIAFFRSLPDEVTLCLWRQVLPVSSPLSPLSPTMPFFSEEEKKTKPKPLLRKEALDMLSDKARLKKDKKINSSPKSHKEDHNEQDLIFQNVNKKENTIDCNTTISEHSINERNKCISSSSSGITSTVDSSSQNTELYCETDSSGCGFDILDHKLNESDFIHINAARSPSFARDINEYEISSPGKLQRPSFLDLSSDNLSPRKQKYGRSFFPTSPQETHSENLDSDFKSLDSNDSLSASDNNPNTATSSEISPLPFTTQDSALMKWRGMTLNGEDEKTDFYKELQMKSSQITVELDRRWNSRLGFSLVTLDTGEIPTGIFVKFIYPGSLAALDGRLQPGDRLIKVNDDHVTGLSVQEVIDLLRKSQGKVAITVERIPDNFHRQLSNSSGSNVLSRSQSENESLLSNEITAMNVKNNNINRCYRWEASSTSPVDNESYNLKV